MYDFHLHTHHSFDASHSPAEIRAAAARAGLHEICFTDHIDYDGSGESPADLSALCAEVHALQAEPSPVQVRVGAEISLYDESCAQKVRPHLAGWPLDFVIGSVHLLENIDPYIDKSLFDAPKEEVYRRHLAFINRAIRTYPDFCVLGHYDYIAKCAPYADRSFPLSVAPDLFDEIFTYLIAHGKGIELNTAAWRDDPAWGLDILRRWRELGGEFITVGSDAHVLSRVGYRIDEALDLARAAGIRYIATFSGMQPILHPL